MSRGTRNLLIAFVGIVGCDGLTDDAGDGSIDAVETAEQVLEAPSPAKPQNMDLAALVPTSATAVAGAMNTTINASDGPDTCFNGPGVVNCNIYADKTYVWIDGKPTNNLSDGTYFFMVGVPGGENDSVNDGGPKNLSDDYDTWLNRRFTVSGGVITSYTPDADGATDNHDFTSGKIRLSPYADTSNPGGEYFAAICQYDPATYPDIPVDPDACKYDNFKVKAGDTVVEYGMISGLKYYDANTNGKWDVGEVGIEHWPIDFTDGESNTVCTGNKGTFTLNLPPDDYTFAEQTAGAPWMQTGNTCDQSLSTDGNTSILNTDKSYSVTNVANGSTSGLNFGNVCVGAGGGLTLGFWSNKNGQALFGAGDLALMVTLNLRNANGSNFDPANYAAFRTWLLAANATNMAYMLSAQLAAMELNVLNGKVDGASLIYAPGATSANPSGFATVSAVMTEANTELGANGLTLDGSPSRSYQEALKNALDGANNNLNFVQPGPSSCPTNFTSCPVEAG